MKKIIAKINFRLGEDDYIAGEEINVKDIILLRKLNEKGFIEPLNYEDLVLIEREIKNKNKNKKEEE